MRFIKNIKPFLISTISFLLSLVILMNHAGFSISELNEHVIGAGTCSAENEKDACHRYVYHHEESRDCDGSHKHVSAAQAECFGCKYFKQHQETITEAFGFTVHTIALPFYHSDPVAPPLPDPYFSFYQRGPPALS